MFVAVAFVRVMQRAVMQVIDVVAVDDGGMFTIWPVGVRVIGYGLAGFHGSFL